MTSESPTRDDLALEYLEALPYEPYPVQEQALMAWFSAEQGVLVCAPTGTGKTLIAEAAMYEALHTGKTAYYTTPLIALTEQKFREMQEAAVKWGFQATDVGLVTGNRRENPEARILVVVAEILLNRLLHTEAFEFSDVAAVVMDEFHNFADRERGIVWELTLALLPPHIRTLLLSATVGNSMDFVIWLRQSHRRKLELVQSTDRKVPLTYQWVPDQLLLEQLEGMAQGTEAERLTPALVFCFNREECWTVAEQLKGKNLLGGGQKDQLLEEIEQHDWSLGAGPKLKRLLMRGVGVHHAGVIPRYRRIVEDLFQKKLLSVATCTETLAAGINLPARSVVIPRLLKGPPGKKKVIEASSAHQIFGRAGRPQFDSQGYVFALAHEDDVKIVRAQAKLDQIPADTKDPGLLKARKSLKKKMPKRRTTEQYWNEAQFNKLREAPPGKLYSKGPLPWRLLAYMLDASSEVDSLRELVSKRLMDPGNEAAGQVALDKMLTTLWRAGYVTLEPEPPRGDQVQKEEQPTESQPEQSGNNLFGASTTNSSSPSASPQAKPSEPEPPQRYQAHQAHATPELQKLLIFRSVNPLYGVFLINQLGIADRAERIQAMESVLEMPGSVNRFVRVPRQEELPPGPLATTRLDSNLLRLGLVSAEELSPSQEDDQDRRGMFDEEKKWVLTLAEKLRIQFDYDFPGVDMRTGGVWCVGELLEFGGDFNKYITSKQLQKQEGIILRHALRMILLIAEFKQLTPPECTEQEWHDELNEISDRLTETCRSVDPDTTEKTIEQAETPRQQEL